jgi:hypothetical protein
VCESHWQAGHGANCRAPDESVIHCDYSPDLTVAAAPSGIVDRAPVAQVKTYSLCKQKSRRRLMVLVLRRIQAFQASEPASFSVQGVEFAG